MKLAIGTALAVLLAGGLTYAQEPEKEKPPQQEEHKKQEPEKHAQQEQQKAREHENHEQQKQQAAHQQEQQREQQKRDEKAQAEHARDTNRDAEKQREQAAKQQQQLDKDRARQNHVAEERTQPEQRDNKARQAQRDGAARNARRIREEDFHAHFGRPHEFRVHRRDDHRFNYGGYWFQYNEVWPSDWSYDDDVYIDDIDGEYYLIDPVHPGIRIVVYIVD